MSEMPAGYDAWRTAGPPEGDLEERNFEVEVTLCFTVTVSAFDREQAKKDALGLLEYALPSLPSHRVEVADVDVTDLEAFGPPED